MPDDELTDRVLRCKECLQLFAFTSGEQRFFAAKGLLHDPQRCADCRAEYKARIGQVETRPLREMHEAVCHRCGESAIVPFLPRQDRPVFCSACFDIVRQEARRATALVHAPAPASAEPA